MSYNITGTTITLTRTVTTVYSNGNQLVKTFSDDMKTITSVLTDSEGKVIATEIKTFSDDGLTISTNVVYGETDAN